MVVTFGMYVYQVLGARIEIARLREENERYRSILTQLSSEYYNLQMHVVASMQRRSDSSQQVPSQRLKTEEVEVPHLFVYCFRS